MTTKISFNQGSKRKASFKCDPTYKDKFKDSSCLMTISVGQEVHEDDKFLLTLDLVNKHFASCTILIGDTLQRHTMALLQAKTADQFYEVALYKGDRWLECYQEFINKMNIPCKISRWNNWLQHPEFKSTLAMITADLKKDHLFKKSIDDTIAQCLTRYSNRDHKMEFNNQVAYQLCFDYLMEECAALCLWQKGEYNFEVYPNKRNDAMSYTYHKYVQSRRKDLLNPISIKFKHRKMLKPQAFSIE